MGPSPLSLAASLPPCRSATSTQICDALKTLRDVFCRLPAAADFCHGASHDALAQTDSGYVTEDEDEADNGSDDGQALRDDPVERDAAVRWLTVLIGRIDELPIEEGMRERIVDDACAVLARLTGGEDEEQQLQGDDLGMTRRFEFDIPGKGTRIAVDLLDTPMQTTDDHTDVGLQTWGASVALSELVCQGPERFDLHKASHGTRFLELGAGTGLFGLALSSLLPVITESWLSETIIATDYHPAVLKNLALNIDSHAAVNGERGTVPLKAAHLDWSAPSRAPPLDEPVDFIFAADVAYAPEHAIWLRDCASVLLAPGGIFWLMVSIRPNGKFNGIRTFVEAAFSDQRAGRRTGESELCIISQESVRKHKSGRADETGYELYRIGWA
ncbi:methyltransferase [Purpureocillium lavendulum]|uniref:Methyltransferase n=1 Tax=Purpureocillium lavendulum TaxID=1247861 RepID=A0AB34FUI4_9HYPO|nr:methyltransferase [Purpureocillium lavendulum]